MGKKIKLVVGRRYFVPKFGQIATYQGRGGSSEVLVDDRGRHIMRRPHIFTRLGGLARGGCTDEEAAEAVEVKK